MQKNSKKVEKTYTTSVKVRLTTVENTELVDAQIAKRDPATGKMPSKEEIIRQRVFNSNSQTK